MPTRSTVPFSIDRNDSRPLVRQIVDGVREAVSSGRYVPGDVVPPYVRLAQMLGVSRIVTLEALKRLSAEGIVEARPRRGTFIRDTALKQWRGHVVVVYSESDVSFFQTVFADTLRARLNRAGYLFTRATVECDASSRHDYSLLDAAMARSVDFAIVLYNRPGIFHRLSAHGVPFAVLSNAPKDPEGSVHLLRFDYERAVPGFVAACERLGIRRVVQLRWDRQMCDAAPALSAAGVDVTTVSAVNYLRRRTLADVEEAGRLCFADILARGRPARDTAFFFTDDYLARGAIISMLDAGLRAPDDIRFASWANTGLGPSYLRELSRMEMNPATAGEAAADAILGYLRAGVISPATIGPTWFDGETLAWPT